MKRRILATFLSLCLLVGGLPNVALAEETEGLCTHHSVHTDMCGYIAPVAEITCGHVHTVECYSDGKLPEEGVEKTADTCTHTDHNQSCGYIPGSPEKPCTYNCTICPVEALITALPSAEEVTEANATTIETAKAAYDALSAAEQEQLNAELVKKLNILVAVKDEIKNSSIEEKSEEETILKEEFTEEKILLENKYDIYALADIVNGLADERDFEEFSGYYPADVKSEEEKRNFIKTASFVITNDMTISSEDGFQGIGFYNASESSAFSGSIDGQKHTITFDIDSADYYGQSIQRYFAFVGYLAQSDEMNSPVIENIQFTGDILLNENFIYVASAVGYMNTGTVVSNIVSDVHITNQCTTSSSRVGGIAGCNLGTISNVECYSDLTSICAYKDNGWAYVGGICARSGKGSVIEDAIFDGTLAGNSADTITSGLITAYTSAADGPAKFENIVVSGDVKIEAQGASGTYVYYGTLGGRTDNLSAKDIVVYDTTIRVDNNVSQARVGALIAGAHGNVDLDNCIINNCTIITGGGTGNNYQIGGVIGYAPYDIDINDVISNCQLQIANGEDLGTGYYLAGFASNVLKIQEDSGGNLFSANKAGFLSASRLDQTDPKYSKGIAGFYATEKLVIPSTGNVAIAENSSNDKDNSPLNSLNIQWGYRDASGELQHTLPAGMTINWDETGNNAELTTSNVQTGNYTLVPYVVRHVANQDWVVELADIAVSVQTATAPVDSVTLQQDNGSSVSTPIELQALSSDSTTVTAVVNLEDGSEDVAGVIWKFYDNSGNELTPAYLAQYLTISVDGNHITLDPDRIFQSASVIELKIKAISVTDPEKTAEATLKLKPLLVKTVTFVADEGTIGSGTESDPYVLYTGQVLGGYGQIIMSDDHTYGNQRLNTAATIQYLVFRNKTNNQTIQPSINNVSGRVQFTAKAEGLVTATIKSVTLGSSGEGAAASDPIYILIKAPVQLTLTSDNIKNNEVSILNSQFEQSVGTLTATATVSNAKLYSEGDTRGKEIAAEEYAKYREPTEYTIESSDDAIATLDENNQIIAHGFGTVVFTATGAGKGTDGKAATAQYILQIKDSTKTDQDAPSNVLEVATSHYDQEDGSITGLDVTKVYEYRLSTSTEYISVVAGNTEITGLAAGTYLLRVAGNDEQNPSADVEITIASGPKYDRPAPEGIGVENVSSETSENGKITGVDSSMEYAPSYSNIFRPITDDTINGLTVGTYHVRYAETDHYNASDVAVVEILVSDNHGSGNGGAYHPEAGSSSGADRDDETHEEIIDEETPLSEGIVEPFVDVSIDSWYADAVQYVYENGMMGGTSETTFSPNLTTTRGMIVTILYRLENEPTVTGTTAFTDVAADQYYANAVAWAAQNGIVSGTTATTFAPNNAITREQMAAILYRYAQFKGYDVSAKADLSVYTDAASVGAYAVDAMAWANGAQLITGTSSTTLSPAGNATRAQVATILMRFCENIAK